MITLYVRCQIKDYIPDIVAARAGMRINEVNYILLSSQNKVDDASCSLKHSDNEISLTHL